MQEKEAFKKSLTYITSLSGNKAIKEKNRNFEGL